ncbi:amidase family protein [Frankia sp. AgB32]|uniref:amidase family protein n=1 Tax=Frankia sp. AgB32 TaxID=631119 RepID=UPI00201021F8|nr:amidase family protein [Frankia sp. AgB32]MCK9893562.1 amidase family protein [Frankia sp. AgB32]
MWREHGDPLLPPTGSGALDGLRMAVKDLFALGGHRVGAGNPTVLAGAPTETADADAVRLLRAAGAAVAGIARTDELAFALSGANTHYGTPPNPAAPERVSGGSTSGPASAVAAGLADFGLGTDTAGSVRVPASVCGLYGLRPTHGAVSLGGVLGLAPSFDTVGWLAADAGVLLAVGDVLLPPGLPARPARLFVVASPGTAERGATPAPEGPVEIAARLADALDVRLVVGPMSEDPDAAALFVAFRAVQAAEAWRLHGRWITTHPAALDAEVEARFRFGATIDGDAERAARRLIAEGRARLLDRIGADTWIVRPATAGPAHLRSAGHAQRDTWRQATLGCTVAASAYGLPSCVVPTVSDPVGPHVAPVGVAIVGPPGADRALLGAAVALGRPALA